MTAAGDAFTVTAGGALRGRVRVPGDKSVSHRALILAALADGTSRLTGLSDGDDVVRTAAALRALGATVDGGVVAGGAGRLHAPAGPLDCGNSGTGMRLLAGTVAGWPWTVELVGDASLSARPMDRIAEPLRAMGATVEGQGDRCRPPLTVRGGALRGVDYAPPVPSAQVKGAVLLAGLRAAGPTVVREARRTRGHTEELLVRFGAEVDVADDGPGRTVTLRPGPLSPTDLAVPGDPSQAAFWVVAACLVPGSRVEVDPVYVGPGRRGAFDVLGRMGARLEERPAGAHGAELVAEAGPLRATAVAAEEVPGLVDEVPVLAVAAAGAAGTTVFRGLGELRVKESDRLAGTAGLVRAFGGRAEVDGDDLAVTGPADWRPAVFDAGGDHRMAMAAVVAGLAAGAGATVVTGWAGVATSYPAFAADLAQLRAGR